MLTVTERSSDIFRCFPIPQSLSRTVNLYLKANKPLFTISGPFTIKFMFLMGLLIQNRLPVISQTIFIKVAVRQQMWAPPDKSLLLSETTLFFLPLCSRQSQQLRKHRMEQGERNGYHIATDGNPSTQLSQKLEGRYFISPFFAGALFISMYS